MEGTRRRQWRVERPVVLNVVAGIGLAILSVVAYAVDLQRNGLGNPFYAAAVQSGAHSVHNAFFAAITFDGSVSVDKPPLSLWMMEASVRVFGLSSFGELLPDAICGMATTAVVVLMVREWTSVRWGLFAGLLSLASPMANVMFRFNNPEALLTLLTTAAIWSLTSAMRRPRLWKLICAGVLFGAAILTKLLVGVIILPVVALAYAALAPTSPLRRLGHLAALAGSLVVSAGWYFVAVAMTPQSARPWLDGTDDDQPLTLLISSSTGRMLGKGHSHTSAPGLLRMFNHEELANYGPLIVLAIATAVVVLAVALRAHRADLRQLVRVGRDRPAPGAASIALVLLAAALWVCLVMSYAQAGYHSYYAVIGMPVMAAGVSIGWGYLWSQPSTSLRRWGLVAILIAGAAFDAAIWSTYSTSWVFDAVLAGLALMGTLVLGVRPRAKFGLAVLLLVALILPGYYTTLSWRDNHNGGAPLGGPLGAQAPWDGYAPRPNDFWFPSRVTPQLSALLRSAGPYAYAVAVEGDEQAGCIQLATGVKVLPLTGWLFPIPGIKQRLIGLISDHAIRYFLPPQRLTDLSRWVQAHFASVTVGDQTVYDFTTPL